MRRRHYASSQLTCHVRATWQTNCPFQEWDQIGFFIWQLRGASVCVCICVRAPYALMLVVVVLSFFFESLTGSSVPIMRDGC